MSFLRLHPTGSRAAELKMLCIMVTVHDANQRLGFALPSKLVRSVFEELKTSGHVTYGDIGFKVQNVTPILARGLHLSQEWGMIVSDVSPGKLC